MASWSEFESRAPDIAAAGRRLLYQFGPGLAYLATLRADGAPRIHPVCPAIHEGRLYLFIGNQTPKKRDLLRDGRFALHAFSPEDRDDEFTVSGRATPRYSDEERAGPLATYLATGATTQDDTMFELDLDRALYAQYRPRAEGDTWPPKYHRWRA
ncbi:MAG: pyridoxamine 5'-phosphate oxidase family protein [Dehalococcoidia bacterium]|nr:pyridoxamine 5'-phosphate oxidase family protein [Dehalococcoidia bacterium]